MSSVTPNGPALVWIYSQDSEAEAMQAMVLSKDEARRIQGIGHRLARLVLPGISE